MVEQAHRERTPKVSWRHNYNLFYECGCKIDGMQNKGKNRGPSEKQSNKYKQWLRSN